MAEFDALLDTREMVAAVEQLKEPETFFLDTFAQEMQVHETKLIEIDLYDEDRLIAPFTLRRAEGQNVELKGFDKFIFEPPYSKPRITITPSDLDQVQPGELAQMQGGNVMSNRFIYLVNKIFRKLNGMLDRTEELMLIQALFNRETLVWDEEKNELAASIKYTADSSLNTQVSTLWDNSAADCLRDIQVKRKIINKLTGLNANVAILGSDAADEFEDNAKVQRLLDNRRFEIGEWVGERSAKGGQYLGTLKGIDYWRVDEWYKDPVTGVETEKVPAKKVLLGSTDARVIRHRARIESFQALGRIAQYPKAWSQDDPESYTIQLHRAMLPAVHQPNAFAAFTVLT
jgi:hypothetical protein